MIASNEERFRAEVNAFCASRFPTLFGNSDQKSENSRALSVEEPLGSETGIGVISLGGVGGISLGERLLRNVTSLASLSVTCDAFFRAL